MTDSNPEIGCSAEMRTAVPSSNRMPDRQTPLSICYICLSANLLARRAELRPPP